MEVRMKKLLLSLCLIMITPVVLADAQQEAMEATFAAATDSSIDTVFEIYQTYYDPVDDETYSIVGWKVSTRMNTDMVLDALEQALHDRGMPKNVIHHSDRGVQYLSIRYTNRLEAANLRASVGTTGDSYDNALAETVNGLYKTEVIEYLKADWQGLADVQLATLNWVDWFNKERVHSALGYVSPFEFEAMYYDKINPLGQVA